MNNKPYTHYFDQNDDLRLFLNGKVFAYINVSRFSDPARST